MTTARARLRFRSGSAARAQHASSFGDYSDSLTFSAWNFFHAAKKTELASSFTKSFADRRAQGFAFEHADTFIWDTDNFRKVDSDIFQLEDFASSGLAGRVGEAMAYLTMMKWGYVYWDRLASVWSRAARQKKITHSQQLHAAKLLAAVGMKSPSTEPDFVFEKANRTVALVEAKGSFVNPRMDNPTTKADMRKALIQLGGWSKLIAPKPSAVFGIGTYLREESDVGSDDSLIAFVDPPGEVGADLEPVDLPKDLIRRANYGVWLVGMGLGNAGRALMEMREKPAEQVSLPATSIDGMDIAFAPMAWSFSDETLHFPPSPLWWHEFGYRPHRMVAMGLRVEVLRLLEKAIRMPSAPVLMDIEGEPLPMRGRDYWSVMPDGSFLGRIREDKWRTELFDL